MIGTAAGIIGLLAIALSVFLLGRGGDDDTPAASTAPASTQVLPLRLPAPQDVTVSAVPDQAQVVVRWSAVGAPGHGHHVPGRAAERRAAAATDRAARGDLRRRPAGARTLLPRRRHQRRRPDRRRERPGLPVNALLHPSVSAPPEFPDRLGRRKPSDSAPRRSDRSRWPPVVGAAGPRRRGRHRRRRHRGRRGVRRHRAVLWMGEGGGDRRRGHPRPPHAAAGPHQVRHRPRSQRPVDGGPQP